MVKLIKKIINWIINFFKKLFGIRDNKKTLKEKKINKKNRNYLEKYGVRAEDSFREDFPSYYTISVEQKALLLENAKKIEKRILKTSVEKREKEIKRIINILFSDIRKKENEEKQKNQIIEIEKLLKNEKLTKLDEKKLDNLLDGFSLDKKKEVLEIYKNIKKEDENASIEIRKIDDTIELINGQDITLYTIDEIDKEIDKLLNDKELEDNINIKIDEFNSNVYDILVEYDRDVYDKVKSEFNELNYVTISTLLIDNTIKRIQKLEEDYKKHRYNKNYYEREVNKIKNLIKNLENIKDSEEVKKEIIRLRKELRIKSKDKYDLLYNNEIFMNLDEKCDILLNNVNRKVVDIKNNERESQENLEKEKLKQEEELRLQKEKRDEMLRRILERFQDMELARRLILLSQKKSIDLLNPASVTKYMEKMYSEFVDGVDENFNFQRNKSKTEMVKLYNDINLLNCALRNEGYISLDHINFRMTDLIEASKVKKGELESTLEERYHLPKDYFRGDDLVDEKIMNLTNIEKMREDASFRPHVLKRIHNNSQNKID